MESLSKEVSSARGAEAGTAGLPAGSTAGCAPAEAAAEESVVTPGARPGRRDQSREGQACCLEQDVERGTVRRSLELKVLVRTPAVSTLRQK